MGSLACIFVLGSFLDAKPKLHFVHSVRIDEGGYSVVISAQSFDPAKHRLSKKDGSWRIDGKPRFGCFMSLPDMELAEIRASWHGRDLRVPRRLWQHCYRPNGLENPGSFRQYVHAAVSKREITVTMLNADAAASYKLVLHLRRDGRHWRELAGLG